MISSWLWVGFGAFFGPLVTSFLKLMQTCLGDLSFRVLSWFADLEDHHLAHVDGSAKYVNTVRTIANSTRRFSWRHTANVLAEDGLEYGSFFLPTRSLLLKVLSWAHVTHWVYVNEHNGDISTVGPRSGVREWQAFFYSPIRLA